MDTWQALKSKPAPKEPRKNCTRCGYLVPVSTIRETGCDKCNADDDPQPKREHGTTDIIPDRF